MSLASCPTCHRVLDVPGVEFTYRQIDGQCRTCHERRPLAPKSSLQLALQAAGIAPGRPPGETPPTPQPPPPLQQPQEYRMGKHKAGPGRHSVAEAAKLRQSMSVSQDIDPDAPENPAITFDVDPPEPEKKYAGKYPFPDMPSPTPGPNGKPRYASFLVPVAPTENVNAVRQRLYNAAMKYRKDYNPMFEFKVRVMQDGVRVFRMEDSAPSTGKRSKTSRGQSVE